jgi:hypothetical protein
MISPKPALARRWPDLTALTFYPNQNRRASEIGKRGGDLQITVAN